MPAQRSDEQGLIELKIRDLSQLFNSMDPSPFLDKDLDQEAEDFICSWAAEFPADQPLKLLLHIAEPKSDVNYHEVVEPALRNFFSYRADLARREFRHLMARGRLTLLIGLSVLVFSIVAGELLSHLGDSALLKILRESLLIGGWVAMWRPIQTFLYDWWPIRRQWRDFERLSRMGVEVVVPQSPV